MDNPGDDIDLDEFDDLDDLDDDEELQHEGMTAEQFAAEHPVFTPVLDPKITKVNDKVLALIAPIVADLGLDLYDFEFAGGIVKVTIDTPPGTLGENGRGGVTLDQLALVTRLIGRDLDHHDPIPTHYTLEVSSPGLERNLRTPTHFRREIGKSVNIRLRVQLEGQRRFQGVLVAADEATATVRLDDKDLTERVIPIDLIDRAKTVFHWEKGEKGTPTSAKAAAAASPKARPKNSPKRSKSASAANRPKGPSDELDSPIHEEATR